MEKNKNRGLHAKKIRVSTGEKVFGAFNYVLMAAVGILCLYPMWYVLMASFSSPNQMIMHTGGLLKPLGFSTGAYAKVFANPNIISGYTNTIFILVVGVSLLSLIHI